MRRSCSLIICGLLFGASPLPARATHQDVHYRYREHGGTLQRLTFTACPWPEAIALFEQQLHARVSVAPGLARQLFRQPIYFEFKEVAWPNALRVLALANHCDLAQDSPRQYRLFRPFAALNAVVGQPAAPRLVGGTWYRHLETICYRADGTFSGWERGHDEPRRGTWERRGRRLTQRENGRTWTYRIRSLTDKELKLTFGDGRSGMDFRRSTED